MNTEIERRLTVLKSTYPTNGVRSLVTDVEQEFELLLGLLRDVMACDDLTGWSGPTASPLCDRISDVLAKRTGRVGDAKRD